MPRIINATTILIACAAAVGAARSSRPAVAQNPPKEWTMEELLPAVKDLGTGRDFKRGRELFKKTACGMCHAFARESEGAGLAPDLTGVGATYDRAFILESIVKPSATINPRFSWTKFTLKDGNTVTGSVVDSSDKTIVVAPIMMSPQTTIDVNKAEVKSEEPSPVSPMPAGLLNQLTRDEILELLAFLESGGDPGAPVYRKKS